MLYPLSSVLTFQLTYKKSSIIALLGLAITLSACQKSPDTQAEPTVEPKVITTDNQTQNSADVNEQNLEASNGILVQKAQNSPTTSVENAPNNPTITPNPDTLTLSPQQPQGTQVTDVYYRSAAGETLSVVFQTSATGVLNAVITLSNDTKITLSAPEGQGNNPTYRSADGKIELVSHQGGTVIDLIRNDTMTSFTAISAEAEVITQT